MSKEFIKGNDAIAKAALLAGCTHYYGYPITPSSEIIHACSSLFPQVGGAFVQAESEVSAINMVYGAAACGKRVMTASSSPGISLKQEGMSYLAAAELPCVVVNVQRAGPGLGNIWPEQADYNQAVKGGGHGNYKVITLAPNSPQEMCDLTILAFDLADQYRTPVYLLADAYVGQVMEPVEFPTEVSVAPEKPWAIKANKETQKNLVTSIRMNTEEMEALNVKLQKVYKEIEDKEVRYHEFMMDDAEVVVVAYGITSRMTYSAIEDLRAKGIKVGLFRPITLFPFPKKRLMELTNKTKLFVVVELSNGQMVDDVRLATEFKKPIEFFGRMGGYVPEQNEIAGAIETFYKKHLG
jgi:pyruvate/2-oxoacid:ferredoxin oxidoreductase alpha subunit